MNRSDQATYAELARPSPQEQREREARANAPETPSQPVSSLDVVYPGVPVPKGSVRAGKGPGGRAKLYTDKVSDQAMNSLAWFLVSERRRAGWRVTSEPIFLLLEFGFRPPKSWPMWKHDAVAIGELVGIDYLRHDSKPDVDNLVKLVNDAANGILWHDDAQVVSVYARKVWAAKAYTRIQLELQPAGPQSAAEWKALTRGE